MTMTNEIIKDETQTEESSTALITNDECNVLPSFPTKSQIKEYENFLENYDNFVGLQLKDGIDFGVIPGVEKPTLLKPGAEKLEKLYFYRHEKINVERIVQEDFIKYTYRTVIYNKSGQKVATCEGTCNSHEKKYRYRNIPEWEANEDIKKNVKPEMRKAKSGKSYGWYKVENTEVADLENTIMKMAQKRSYVGAILEATNSSGRFTQDVEDMAEFTAKTPQRPAYHPARPLPLPLSQDDDIPVVEYGEYGEPVSVKPAPAEPFPSQNPARALGICPECGGNITQPEIEYSTKIWGFAACRQCQAKLKKPIN